jgi:hypothetical protein
MTNIREALIEMEKVLTRRAFFIKIVKGAGVAAVYDRFGPRLFGDTQRSDAASFDTALQIFSAFGQLVIPVDQDPGWATFEPDITQYAFDTYVRQVFALGNDLAFNGLTQAIIGFNEIPPQINYGPKFLDMTLDARGNYLTDVLTSNFENDGVQDILSFGGIFMLLGVKQTFFLNFPHHIADPNAEFQNLTGFAPKTGWDIMGFRGPVGQAEEQALRARSAGAPELPGVDWRNPWI